MHREHRILSSTKVEVVCPYCGEQAKLVDSSLVYQGRSYGMIWLCNPCWAWTSTHKNSTNHKPVGRLANKELRDWKIKAHAVFDPMWKNNHMSRKKAYKWLAKKMEMQEGKCHIGWMDIEECKKVVEICEKVIKNKEVNKNASKN